MRLANFAISGPLTLLSSIIKQRIKVEAYNLAVNMRKISTQIQRLIFKRGVAYGHVTQFRNSGTPL